MRRNQPQSQSQMQDKKSISNQTKDAAKTSLEKAYKSPSPTTSTNTTKQGPPGKGPTVTKVTTQKSSLIAASKANFAEKYGTVNSKGNANATPTSAATTKTAHKPSNVRSTVGDTKKVQGQTKTITNPGAKPKKINVDAKLSTPQNNAKTISMNNDIENNYEDDFEEDYPSDFEQFDDDEAQEISHVQEVVQKDTLNVPEDQDEVSELEGQQSPKFIESSDSDSPPQLQSKDQPGFFQRTSIPQNAVELENKIQVQGGSQTQNVQKLATTTLSQNFAELTENVRAVGSDSKTLVPRRGFNFEGAKRESKLIRSQQLKKMISLHNTNPITLFHLVTSPDQYAFSVSGTLRHHKGVQVEKSQNNHSGQTDPQQRTHKWTQRPPTWSTADKARQSDINVLREEALGVGTEPVIVLDSHLEKSKDDKKFEKTSFHQMQWDYDVGASWSRISKFISRASRKVLYVLESQKRLALSDGSMSSEAILTRGLPAFSSLEMGCLTCSGDYLACANFYPVEKCRKKHEAKSVITVWSMKEPSCPKFFLRMWGKITAITIFVYGHVVVAGGNDGGLAIWDLDENPDYHKLYQDHTIRTASIDTALIDQGHKDVIVGIKVISQTEDNSLILSMDKFGVFKTWSLLRSSDIVTNPNYPRHTAYWSRLNLSHKTTINLNDCLAEKVLLLSTFIVPDGTIETRITDFVCGTVNGFAIRTSLIKSKKDESIILEYYQNFLPNPKANGNLDHGDGFDNEITDGPIITKQCVMQKYYPPQDKSSITAIDINSSLNLCLAGSVDGKCRLYSLPNRKVLITFTSGTAPVRIHFSKRRLSVFYITLNNAIHIYDLLKSETRPWKVIAVPNIIDMEIYVSVVNEFTVVLASNELKASMMCGDLQELTNQEYAKFHSRLNILRC